MTTLRGWTPSIKPSEFIANMKRGLERTGAYLFIYSRVLDLKPAYVEELMFFCFEKNPSQQVFVYFPKCL